MRGGGRCRGNGGRKSGQWVTGGMVREGVKEKVRDRKEGWRGWKGGEWSERCRGGKVEDGGGMEGGVGRGEERVKKDERRSRDREGGQWEG